MSNQYFLKKSHINISAYVILIYITMVIVLLMIGLRQAKVTIGLASTFVFSTAMALLLMKYYNSIGLYIDNMNVYYKGLRIQNIDITMIAGIKIIQSYSTGKYRGFYPVKNRKEGCLYSAILLRSITDDMYNYQKGDLWFNADYKKQIICSVVYDKNAVDYLTGINFNIKIL